MSDTARQSESGGRLSRALTRGEFEAALDAHYRSLVVIGAAAAGRDRAEDVVHDAALVAMRKLDDFSRGTNFGAWMAAIVRNVASNTVRGERRRTARERAAGRRSPTQARSDSRDDGRIPELLDALSPPQRECLMLRVALSHSYGEIAAITGMPPATVRSHVLRARRRLLDIVTEEDQRHD